MALPIRGLASPHRSSRSRGRSSSSERSGASSRFSRRGRSQSSERSSRTGRSSRFSRRSASSERSEGTEDRGRRNGASRWRSSSAQKSRKKDALFKNYGRFARRDRSEERDVENQRDNGSTAQRSRGSPSPSSQRSRGSPRRSRSRGSPSPPGSRSGPGTREGRFLLPPNLSLSPRSDVYFALLVTSCASISSFVQLLGGGRGDGKEFANAGDIYALSVCAVSFAASAIMAGGMRYAPFRRGYTSAFGSGRGRPRNLLGALLQEGNVTPEIVLLTVFSVLWLGAIAVIANGSPGTSGGMDLAVSGNSIWNANLFYSSWATAILFWYLFVEVATLHDRSGVVPRHPTLNSSYRGWSSNVLPKRWSLLFVSSVVLMAASIRVYTGPMCAGMLKGSDLCSRSLSGVVLGGFVQLFLCFGVGVLSRLGRSRGFERALPLGRRNKVTFGVALSSLLVQSINVGVLTSPTGGGPATSSGTIYFASWIGFILSFEMLLRYLEFFSTYGADGNRVPDDPIVRAPPPPMIRSESVSSKRGERSTGTASSSDSEDRPVLLQIVAEQALPPALPPIRSGRCPSEASASQERLRLEPSEVFSIGSAPKQMEPGGESKESPLFVARDPSSQSSSKGSKNPEGFYLEAPVYQNTSFRVETVEELDQSKQRLHSSQGSMNRSNLSGLGRSKSPRDRSTSRLESLAELSNEKSTSPSTSSPPPEAKRPPSRNSSRSRQSSARAKGNSFHGGKNKSSSSRASSRQSKTRSRPPSQQSNQFIKSNRFDDSPPSTDSNDAPPTISDGMSTCDTTSEYLPTKPARPSRQPRRGSKSNVSNRSKTSRGPPPPPFHRNNEATMTPNSMGQKPLQSVSTFSGMNFDVSEPTLDVHFDPPIPTMSEARAAKINIPSKPHQGDDYGLKDSSSTNSYDYGKKWSDSTDAAKTQNRYTDDENPSSSDDEGNKNQVDDIVAAALAYAEKSHCEDGVHSYSTASHARKGPAHDESIHSFYSHSDGPLSAAPSEEVDDVVARVLSEAGDSSAQRKRNIATLAGQTKLLPPRSTRSSMAESSMYSQYSEESGSSFMLDGQFNC